MNCESKFEKMEDPVSGVLEREKGWANRGAISTADAGALGRIASEMAARRNKRPYGNPEILSNLLVIKERLNS